MTIPFQEVFSTKEESFMRAFAMSLGEFNFHDYSERFPREAGLTRRGFFMMLFGSMIVYVSLTIYNLFIAVVISDVKDLKDAVFIQVGRGSGRNSQKRQIQVFYSRTFTT